MTFLNYNHIYIKIVREHVVQHMVSHGLKQNIKNMAHIASGKSLNVMLVTCKLTKPFGLTEITFTISMGHKW